MGVENTKKDKLIGLVGSFAGLKKTETGEERGVPKELSGRKLGLNSVPAGRAGL